MPLVVWKFLLPVKSDMFVASGLGPFELEMPRGASVLTVAIQDDKPTLWALVDPVQPMEKRQFLLAGTGKHEIPAQGFLYVGTFQMGWFVGHVFQEICMGEKFL